MHFVKLVNLFTRLFLTKASWRRFYHHLYFTEDETGTEKWSTLTEVTQYVKKLRCLTSQQK